ncbi:MFS transporter [Armatimonas rosea]|uniref:MFS family permease n=1 Tax=Armatimonas rosea TaxID=685828 RepID=A0A7W9W8M6_ARMRO|nr:MFS transporter [Armatimonas rosea]MBB6052320.1 MFS family permease [Armatimonas rosea]
MSDKLRLRLLLGAMMFFQYAAWGAWAPVLGATLGSAEGPFKASGSLIGAIFGVLWLACIFVPFVGGQLVDRTIASQKYMGISALFCALAAWMMSQQTSTGNLLPEIFPIIPTGGFALWLVLWSVAFAPSIGIGNAIVLHHLAKETDTTEAERERAFSMIRTAGTVGWIVVAFIEGWAKSAFPNIPVVEMAVSAIAAVLWAVASFLVPNVPPALKGVDPFAFKRAFTLFGKVPGFTAFMIISLIASAEFQFFYTLSGQFLGSLGVPEAQIAPYKSTSQMAEVISLAFLLPICLKKFGMRWTLVIGTLAWSVRYFIFATKLFLPVVFSLSLHGVGFAFVFVTSYFYIDRVAPKDIRGSAQSLFTLVTLGVGNWLGSILSGKLQDAFTTKSGEVSTVNWPMVFIVPAALTLFSAIAFAVTFKEPKVSEDELPATFSH